MQQLIRDGYNKIARDYLSRRSELKSTKYVTRLIKMLQPGSHVLDLGCGAGVPADRELADAGMDVTGVDISEEMIALARTAVPEASFERKDISALTEGEYQADAVVCLYTLFHISRSRHGQILRRFASFLPRGGLLLITLGDRDFEGTTQYLGAPMWWSQWGPRTNRNLIEKAGFEIITDDTDRSGGESHQVILARKV